MQSSAPRDKAILKKGPKLSIDEALWLAKEAGYYTRWETQMQLVRSPSFSPNRNPFLIENFFQVAPEDSETPSGRLRDHAAEAKAMAMAAEADVDSESNQDEEGDPDAIEKEREAHAAIHGTILQHFRSGARETFWHNGHEWLAESEGQGTRRRAAAHVIIRRGSGLITVNGNTDLYVTWPLIYQRMDVCQPFQLTGTAGAYDVFVETKGGGPAGKSMAVRLAVARALLAARPGCLDDLQRGLCLLEDQRQKLSSTPGRPGARAGHAWSKR